MSICSGRFGFWVFCMDIAFLGRITVQLCSLMTGRFGLEITRFTMTDCSKQQKRKWFLILQMMRLLAWPNRAFVLESEPSSTCGKRWWDDGLLWQILLCLIWWITDIVTSFDWCVALLFKFIVCSFLLFVFQNLPHLHRDSSCCKQIICTNNSWSKMAASFKCNLFHWIDG